jgi:iron-sulfur cluster assembly enzyme ISCU, mitochondrial
MMQRTLRVASRATAHIHSVRVASASQLLQAKTQTRSYHDRVIDHYENPRNVGSFSKGDQDVGTGLVGAPACGASCGLQMHFYQMKLPSFIF